MCHVTFNRIKGCNLNLDLSIFRIYNPDGEGKSYRNEGKTQIDNPDEPSISYKI